MTQDEIIRMAREAGFLEGRPMSRLNHFAALVAAHVTETLTKAHEQAFQSYVDQAKADRELDALAARLDEREACAKVVESGVLGHGECAAAIRARSTPRGEK